MIDVNKVKVAVEYFIRKKKLSGRISPPEFNSIAPIAQLNVVNRGVKKKGVEVYSFNADELTVLKRITEETVNNAIAKTPNTFMFLMGISYNYTYVENGKTLTDRRDVDLMRDKNFNKRNDSKIVPPTTKYPIARWVEDGWQISPPDLDKVEITFIKEPSAPKWAYTITNNREVYDANSSVDFELPMSMINELVMEILAMVGINIRQADITNYALTEASNE